MKASKSERLVQPQESSSFRADGENNLPAASYTFFSYLLDAPRRLGRFALWTDPRLYRWFGRMRGHGDCLDENFDVWIDGFPRSANTFAYHAFELANPGVRIRSHIHIAPFLIHAMKAGKPGMLMVRKPEDAAISWTIFWKSDIRSRLENCLDYYVDFHRALRPHLGGFFVARFEQVTTDFSAITAKFNQRFGVNFQALTHDEELVSRCFALIDRRQTDNQGVVNELKTCRPSPHRAVAKEYLQQILRQTPALQRKLQRANEMYAEVMAAAEPLEFRPQPQLA